MILIAESGSTKTDWKIANSDIQINTQGIHPLFVNKDMLLKELTLQFKSLDKSKIEAVYFYGPGCGTIERSQIIENLLGTFFTHSKIKVQSDLLAAARALFQNQKGITCILGTGSNSGYYNGKTIEQQASSLGYILGDEGSGAHIGKQIISKYLKKHFETKLQTLLAQSIPFSTEKIIDKVYRQPYPNRFLASFAPLAQKFNHYKSMQSIAQQSFECFFEDYISIYPNSSSSTVSFVGSLAVAFKETIKQIAQQKQISIGQFVQKPIDLLVEYHWNNY